MHLMRNIICGEEPGVNDLAIASSLTYHPPFNCFSNLQRSLDLVSGRLVTITRPLKFIVYNVHTACLKFKIRHEMIVIL